MPIRHPTYSLQLGSLIFFLWSGALWALDPQESQDPYVLGMGGAGSAIVAGTHAIELNPAGIARSDQPLAGIGLGLRPEGMDLLFSTSVLYPLEDGTVFALSQFSDIPHQPYPRTTYIGTVGLPLNPGRDLFLGFNLKYLTLSSPHGDSIDTGRGLGMDLGLAYDLQGPNGVIASFGLMVRDLSTEVRFNNSYDLSVTRTFIFGAAYGGIPDTRLEADGELPDKTLEDSAFHGKVRLGAERFFQEGHFSIRAGYDGLLDPSDAFSLGIGYQPGPSYEIALALRAAMDGSDVTGHVSFVYGFGDLFKGKALPEMGKGNKEAEIDIGRPTDLASGPEGPVNPVEGTLPKKIAFDISPRVYSPNGKYRAVNITIPSNGGPEVARWALLVRDAKVRVLRQIQGTGPVLPSLSWDGLDDSGGRAPEGNYQIVLRTFNKDGRPLSEDVQGLEILSARARFELRAETPYFSFKTKNGRSGMKWSVSTGSDGNIESWDFEVSDSVSRKVVHEQQGKGRLPRNLRWNGKDLKNGMVADGKYLCLLTAQDKAGNALKSDAVVVTVDNTPPDITLKVSDPWAQPLQGKWPTVLLGTADPAGVQSWTLTLVDEDQNIIREYSGNGDPPGSQVWDGKDGEGKGISAGSFVTWVLTAIDRAGNAAESDPVPVQVDYQPPGDQERLTLNLTTLYFNAQSSTLTGTARKELEKAGSSIRPFLQKSILVIKGYAAPNETGDLLTLSHDRALEVKKYLARAMGAQPDKIFAVGYADQGSTQAPATSLTEDPRRRAVLSLTTTH